MYFSQTNLLDCLLSNFLIFLFSKLTFASFLLYESKKFIPPFHTTHSCNKKPNMCVDGTSHFNILWYVDEKLLGVLQEIVKVLKFGEYWTWNLGLQLVLTSYSTCRNNFNNFFSTGNFVFLSIFNWEGVACSGLSFVRFSSNSFCKFQILRFYVLYKIRITVTNENVYNFTFTLRYTKLWN